MARKRRPTTDSGTVVMHLLLMTTFIVLVLTGLRIASDDPLAPSLSLLDPVLPVENLWYRHLVAATILTATFAGYTVYMFHARLTARVRFDRPRLAGLMRPGQTRWAGLHSLAFWGLALSLVAEIVTGTALFFGGGAVNLMIHFWATWSCLGCVALHVGLQAAMGGFAQLTRIFRPTALVVAPPPPDLAELLAQHLSKASEASREPRDTPAATAADQRAPSTALYVHPAATAAVVLFAVASIGIGAEQATRPVLKIREISAAEAPILDGDLSDPVWSKTEPVSVLTTQGGDFGGNGESLVEVRAVHDGEFAYFAFTWMDPTRSLKHLPLVKMGDGWHVAQTTHDKGDETRFHEDKFAVLLTRPTLPLIGAAIHLTASSTGSTPSSSTGRGLHYTQAGIADVWQWRASHQGLNGHIDNCHFGTPAQPTSEQASGLARYAGGFALDPGPAAYRANVERPTSKIPGSSVLPWRLPRDLAATSRALGRLSDKAELSESEGARWWMTEAESIPYAAGDDRQIPVGTVIPGIVMHDLAPNTWTSVRGVGRWAAGRWTLEIARRLYTGSAYDIPIKTGTLMWVAAFDHSETRHTRHLRPFRLELD